MKLSQNVANPLKGVKSANFQIAYSYSNFSNTGGAQLTGTSGDSDQDFVLQTSDNNKPGRYYGPALLDRTHQISFGGYADAPFGFRISMIGHFDSPLSSAIVSPSTGDPGVDMFQSDFTGDGTAGDPLPGTHFGQFDRGTNASGLAKMINTYNTNVAGTATPAGATLIAAGLMTLPQLQCGLLQLVQFLQFQLAAEHDERNPERTAFGCDQWNVSAGRLARRVPGGQRYRCLLAGCAAADRVRSAVRFLGESV